MESIISKNELEKFKWIINYFDINERNNNGDTLLHRAISHERIDFINYLVKNCHADNIFVIIKDIVHLDGMSI